MRIGFNSEKIIIRLYGRAIVSCVDVAGLDSPAVR